MNTPRFEAQIFGDGLATRGQRVQVELRSRSLIWKAADGREEEAGYERLRATSGGWHGGSILLEWENEHGQRALSLHDSAALEVLRQSAPEALRTKLGRMPARARAGLFRRLAVTTAIAVVVVGGLLTLLVVQSGRLVDAAVRRVPAEWESRLGEMTVAPYVSGGKLVTTGEASRVVAEIGARLAAAEPSPYQFRWHLVDDAQVNALAAPGGWVVVFTGLLNATDSAEELAGVLAHEMQHVVQRHSLRALVRSLGWRATLSLLLGGTGPLGDVTARMVEQLGGLRFSRTQESEADVAGVRVLQAAGIDPRGMATFFEKLAERGGEPPAFLSTHPASADRAQRIRALVGEASSPPPPPLPYAWNWN